VSNADTSKTPDQIRAEIEATRENLGTDVDALAEKVNPSSIAHRQTDKVKNRFTSIKESVMGTVSDKADSVSGVGHSISSAGSSTVDAAKGNALAVGVVAFGVGLLVSSLLPASSREKIVASDLKEKAAPAVDAVKGAAQDAAQSLKEPAQEAFSAVKDSAQGAAETVRSEAQSATSDVKDSAQQSRESLQNG
jgi:gas vesicle protein